MTLKLVAPYWMSSKVGKNDVADVETGASSIA